jgi:hypothetical protein
MRVNLLVSPHTCDPDLLPEFGRCSWCNFGKRAEWRRRHPKKT